MFDVLRSREGNAFFFVRPEARENAGAIEGYLREKVSVKEILTVRQVHGDTVLIDTQGEGDGLIITQPGRAALIRTADCYPVVVYDARQTLAGLFHCGWRGVELGLARKGIRLLRERGADDLHAVLFPGIAACCFEIGPELRDRFLAAEIPVIEREGRLFGDLKSALLGQLKKENVLQVHDMTRCTVCADGFFSYRRDHDARRHASVVILKPE